MKIGIVPSIQEKYINQFEYSCDLNLFLFIKNIYKKTEIQLLTFNHEINKDYNLIIFSGASGNDIISFDKSKKNLIRNQLDNKFFNKALKIDIPIMGICHGAQFIAQKFKSTIKEKKHVGNHSINLLDSKKKFIVNSYHNKVITKLGKNLISKGHANDNTIEYFEHKEKKIVGTMWHPERYKSFKKFDQNIVKRLCK